MVSGFATGFGSRLARSGVSSIVLAFFFVVVWHVAIGTLLSYANRHRWQTAPLHALITTTHSCYVWRIA